MAKVDSAQIHIKITDQKRLRTNFLCDFGKSDWKEKESISAMVTWCYEAFGKTKVKTKVFTSQEMQNFMNSVLKKPQKTPL